MLLKPSGRYIMVGHLKPSAGFTVMGADHLFDGEGKTIKATQGGGFRPDIDVPRYVKLAQAGILNVSGIITHRFPLSEINAAIDLVRDGNASRVMVDFSL